MNTINEERKYVAVSIKHTIEGWKFGKPCVLWGWHQTKNDEPRCFADYTEYLEKAERYALGDFRDHGYGNYIKDDEPVPLTIDFCKRWKEFDTVLVDAEEYFGYCKLSSLPLRPRNTEKERLK